MTRHDRRKVKAQAAKHAENLAGQFARACYDYTPEGQLIRVSDPLAVAALQRAFRHMLRHGCAPPTLRLTAEQVAAFPRRATELQEHPGYLSVGLDPDGRGTYDIRHIVTPGAPPQLAEILNRKTSLHHLSKVTATRGFPMGSTAGRA